MNLRKSAKHLEKVNLSKLPGQFLFVCWKATIIESIIRITFDAVIKSDLLAVSVDYIPQGQGVAFEKIAPV